VSIARWNLKEAAGKALARRTEIAYEACNLDEKASIFKVRYLYGKIVCRCGGHKREGESALPWFDKEFRWQIYCSAALPAMLKFQFALSAI
jgi:hypothetical protein